MQAIEPQPCPEPLCGGLPVFPESLPVTLESRAVFDLAYRATPPSVADLIFNNLFGWQEHFGYRYARYGDFLLVFYPEGDGTAFLPPLLLSGSMDDLAWKQKFTTLIEEIEGRCAAQGRPAVFRQFPEAYVRRLEPGRFSVEQERDCFDYVYRREALANLEGREYAAKRNLIKQFMRGYRYRYEPLDARNRHHLYRFIRRRRPHGTDGNDLASGEYRMLYRLLKDLEGLRLCGGLLFVEDRVVAAAVGSIAENFLYEDGVFSTAVVHAEHALVEYKGAYQVINQLFSGQLPESVVYVNREEDLGIPGLRKAKMSYHPDRLLVKSRIRLNR